MTNYVRMQVANFPASCNAEFEGAGLRTDYVSLSHVGRPEFAVMANHKLYAGDVVHDVTAGTMVEIIKPGKLCRGSTLGITPSRAIYTLVLCNGVIGYFPIRYLSKPSWRQFLTQTRAHVGANVQRDIERSLIAQYPSLIKKSVVAPNGSHAPDVLLHLMEQMISIEVKGHASRDSSIVLFDKSINRTSHSSTIDFLVSIMAAPHTRMEDMIDFHRKEDTSVGYPNDANVRKSGKLPKRLTYTVDEAKLSHIREVALEYWRARKVSFLAIYSQDTRTSEVFFTGVGANVFGAPLIPQLSAASLETHGGASRISMRVGLKVTFANTPGLPIGNR